MFNFKTATTIFFVFFFGMNIISISGIHVSWIFYVMLILIYFGISISASFFIKSGFHMKAYCSVKTDKKEIALTFDDGPDTETTPLVLDFLKNNNIKATFFVIGRKIEGNENIIKRIVEDGHLVGTHSYSHSNWFDLLPPKIMKDEFYKTEERIFKVTGKKPRMFRPPYGVINPMVKRALRGMNYDVIGFSNRMFDTTLKDRKKVILKFTKQLEKGDIVVLHDTRKDMPQLLKEIFEIVEKNQYKIRPLDELLNIDPYEA